MNSRKWVIRLCAAWAAVLTAIAVTVIVIDPYWHYHKPLEGLNYQGKNELYNNNGMLRHGDYNALIIGTSMTSGFSAGEASDLFGENFIRTTFLGEGFYILNENTKTALKHRKDLCHIIRSIDTLWFVTDAHWLGGNDYPGYLYDENPFNDVRYIYNLDVFREAVIPTIWASLTGQEGTADGEESADERADQYLKGSGALDRYERPEKNTDPADPAETEEWLSYVRDNITLNLTDTAEQYPNTEFDLFFPPYSILWWDTINQGGPGHIDRRIDMEQYAVELLLQCPNVRLYSFNDEFDLITDLDNYADDIHYHPNINSYILKCMKEGCHRITADNYRKYIARIREFYTSYDYDSLFPEG